MKRAKRADRIDRETCEGCGEQFPATRMLLSPYESDDGAVFCVACATAEWSRAVERLEEACELLGRAEEVLGRAERRPGPATVLLAAAASAGYIACFAVGIALRRLRRR